MQIWSRYHSPRVETSLLSNVGQPIGPEQAWPFDPRVANTWVPCDEMLAKSAAGKCGKGVDDQARLAKIVARPDRRVHRGRVPRHPDTQVLEAKIAAGQDVMVTIEPPAAFVPKGRPGARYVPHYTKSGEAPTPATPSSSPDTRTSRTRTYFLLHNRWGTSWGDGGYAWMHEATLNLWAREVVAIDAEPLQRDAQSRPRRDRGTHGAPRGLCTGQHSAPRALRRAPTAARATTACARSPVSARRATCEPRRRVRARGAGGERDRQVYGDRLDVWPRRVRFSPCLSRWSPTCTGSVCAASCPAPDFHLAKMGRARVCRGVSRVLRLRRRVPDEARPPVDERAPGDPSDMLPCAPARGALSTFPRLPYPDPRAQRCASLELSRTPSRSRSQPSPAPGTMPRRGGQSNPRRRVVERPGGPQGIAAPSAESAAHGRRSEESTRVTVTGEGSLRCSSAARARPDAHRRAEDDARTDWRRSSTRATRRRAHEAVGDSRPTSPPASRPASSTRRSSRRTTPRSTRSSRRARTARRRPRTASTRRSILGRGRPSSPRCAPSRPRATAEAALPSWDAGAPAPKGLSATSIA